MHLIINKSPFNGHNSHSLLLKEVSLEKEKKKNNYYIIDQHCLVSFCSLFGWISRNKKSNHLKHFMLLVFFGILKDDKDGEGMWDKGEEV